MLKCKKCGKEKRKREFYKEPRTKRGYNARCKVCCKADAKAVFEANPEPYRERARLQNARPGYRRERIMREHGLTTEDYNQMLEEQEYKCSICRQVTATFCLDHCHDSGKPRGLLCHSCNLMLGQAHDNIATLEQAVLYLKQYA